jgi:uncharacterized protein YcfL
MNDLKRTPGRKSVLLLAVLTLLVVVGCGGQDQAEQTSDQADAAADDVLTSAQVALVEKAVLVANAIEKAPAAVAQVMADNDLTVEEYQTLIYRISADPVLSRAYEDARKR